VCQKNLNPQLPGHEKEDRPTGPVFFDQQECIWKKRPLHAACDAERSLLAINFSSILKK
jgi:hypothetical protein